MLNFTTRCDFSSFTNKSIGVPLCQEYASFSMGKALEMYCEIADDKNIVKLLNDLLKHYELYCKDSPEEEDNKIVYEECRALMNRELNGKVQLKTPVMLINRIDRNYIVSIAERANRDIENEEYDSALTKSRTLLEEVFCCVIEHKGEKPSNKGDIKMLYSQVKNLYSMHADEYTDKRIKMLLSGLEKILDAIKEMRDKASDSHGLGLSRLRIKDYHARLFVNSATTVAEFIMSVKENS